LKISGVARISPAIAALCSSIEARVTQRFGRMVRIRPCSAITARNAKAAPAAVAAAKATMRSTGECSAHRLSVKSGNETAKNTTTERIKVPAKTSTAAIFAPKMRRRESGSGVSVT
jgi:hypothetical protein